MPICLEGVTVYRIGEALDRAGLSRATYFRWVREGKVPDTRYRDRNGRRVFTQGELEGLAEEAGKLIDVSASTMGQLRLELAR
jgi:predicted site-specific integrase-resolvase